MSDVKKNCIDHSLEKGDHVLSIISEIEKNESGANG